MTSLHRFAALVMPWLVIPYLSSALGAGLSVRPATKGLTLVALLTDPDGFAGAHDVQVRNGRAYVAGKEGSIAIVDVRRPGAPKLIWSVREQQAYHDAETVLPLEGDRLLVGTQDVLLFDVARPAQPRLIARIHRPPGVHTINGFARRGHVVFGSNKLGQIFAVDVGSPGTITLLGSRNTYEKDGLHSPHDLAFCGDFLVVAAPQGFGYRNAPGKLGVYRVAPLIAKSSGPAAPTRYDPTRAPVFEGEILPAEEWTLEGLVEDTRISGVNRVRARGSFAYLACSATHLRPDSIPDRSDPARKGVYANNVAVVDLTDPARPRLCGQVAFGQRGPNGMDVAGNLVFAAGGKTLQVIDVADPTNPKEVARFESEDVFPGGGPDLHDVAYSDGHLFVTAQNSASLAVFKVSDELRQNGALDDANFYYK